MNASATIKTVLTQFATRFAGRRKAMPNSDTAERKRQRFEAAALPQLDAAYNLARWITGNEREATRVVEDSYKQAFRKFDGYQDDECKTWLLCMVHNTAWTCLQRRRSMTSVIPYQGDGEQAGIGEQNGLRRLIEELSAEYREVFVMRELEQMSYRQIAVISGLPIEAVSARLSIARDRLLQALPSLGHCRHGANGQRPGYDRLNQH